MNYNQKKVQWLLIIILQNWDNVKLPDKVLKILTFRGQTILKKLYQLRIISRSI